MFVDKLYIKNYRCFGEIPTVVEFSKSGLTALIGPNNVGKSTVLKILDILLGDKWPSARFTEDDFHDNNLDKDIVLACTFTNAIKLDIKGHTIPIAGVAIKAKHLSTGYGESSIDVDYRLLESNNNIDDLDFESLDIATYRYKGGGRGDSPIYIGQEIKNQLPIVITIPLIKLQTEQPTNKWSVLGRMLQKVESGFTKDKDIKESFEEKIKEAVKILRISDFNEIETDIQTFWNKMKPANLTGTELKFLDYEPWRYYRQFKLSIKQNGKDVPIESLGEGVQRLAIIALYRTYLKKHGRNERAILLIEEPESYLHPQARKTLFHILKQAIKEEVAVEGQIIYTTHSENFIECGDFDDIVIFIRKCDDSGVEVRHISEEVLKSHTIALGHPEAKISDQHIHYRLIETITQGLKEALFTHKAVIMEGPSEIELFRFFSDAEKEQIGIISAGGKSNIPAIYSFLTAFGVPCLIVMDRDLEDPKKNDESNTKIVNALTQDNAASPDETRLSISLTDIQKVEDGKIFSKDRLLVFGKNLETVLDKQIPDWSEILRLLREAFNLPNESTKPGPRDIQALGLVYCAEHTRDEKVKEKIKTIKSSLDALKEQLNGYVKQNIKSPRLLTPKSE
jgi:predicted ATP-dependent endonuclease of OLD family